MRQLSGWQYVTFAGPVAITAGTTYVASYSSNGHYASTGNFFTTEYTNGILDTSGADASVYTFGAGLCSRRARRLRTIGWMSWWNRRLGTKLRPSSPRWQLQRSPDCGEHPALTVTATDPVPDRLLTYSIVGGADAGQFTIDATTGALAFVTAPNFEAPSRLGCQQRLRCQRGGFGRQWWDRHSSHCGHGDRPERRPDDHVGRRRGHGSALDRRKHRGGDHRDGERSRLGTEVDLFESRAGRMRACSRLMRTRARSRS